MKRNERNRKILLKALLLSDSSPARLKLFIQMVSLCLAVYRESCMMMNLNRQSEFQLITRGGNGRSDGN